MVQEQATGKKKDSIKKSDAAGRQLVIVESPAKAQTINRYLGPDYTVMASVGHVRDLPDRNPKGIKDPVPGVDLKNHFKPTYKIIEGRQKTVQDLKRTARKAAGVWLATDLDREGEAIAWHLAESLELKPEECKRVVFNAITRSEIQKAFQNPRPIDMAKVNAQQARRVLDRIVGYQVSPLLWKKVASGLSAGRVQSVAVRLVVEREREIEAFVPKEFWRITGYFTVDLEKRGALAEAFDAWLSEAPDRGRQERRPNGRTAREKHAWLADHMGLIAELTEVDGRKFEPKTMEEALSVAGLAGFRLDEQIEGEQPKENGSSRKVVQLRGRVAGGPPWRVKSAQTKRTRSRPYAPFITSTLQQTAANQLDFPAQLTMRVAQGLYEGVAVEGLGSVGLITYMRTDSTHLSPDAVKMAREYVLANHGERYLPEKPNVYTSPNKRAQEAHEAIRPTEVGLTPERVRASLTKQQYELYKLIWERFIASQMTDAEWDSTTVLISATAEGKEIVFRATGRVLIFDGYYRIMGVPSASEEAVLPTMSQGQLLAAFRMEPVQNFTSPPPRYSEASLVKKLESEGIGRPSTYAQIIAVIQDRKYVEKTQNRFYATDLGKVVTDKLIEAFPGIMQVGYTRDMEQQLDDIEDKDADWAKMLDRFYGPFKQNLDAAYEGMKHAKAEATPAPHTCPQCGGNTVYRYGRSGRFLSCARYPECKYASPIDRNGNPAPAEQTDVACPKCAAPMQIRKGRFGPFLGCSRYPECDGILNLDRKGLISPPKTPPLLTDLPCPKCQAPMNLRRSSRGPWLSCSKFPKCKGRLGWNTLTEDVKAAWEQALKSHETDHPLIVIHKLDGTPIEDSYKPQTLPSSSDD
jgi:DNA topoisomerase-1